LIIFLVWDGSLSELVRTTRPEKMIKVTLAKPASAELLALIGEKRLLSQEGTLLKLQVPQAELQPLVSGLLSLASVIDLTVEDPPLEEVLADVFAEHAP
jgi:ABC-2 type transport system ATP-binding protein